jgi:hypothetical protein
LDKIALDLGCPPDAIWNHAKNAELKRLRDPNLLLPGDILWVPESNQKWLRVSAGSTSRFVASVPMTTMRLQFGDSGAPIANEPCVIDGTGGERDGTTDATDADGCLVLKVPVRVSVCRVSFPARGLVYDVHIGHMDPIDAPTGVGRRLHNLGYFDLATDDGSSPTASDPRSERAMAIAAFQAEHGLPVTGLLDDETKGKLVDVHGS